MKSQNPIRKRVVLRPEMTIGEVLHRYPHMKLLVAAGRWPIVPERDGHLTLREYAATLRTFGFDTYLTTINNIAVLFDDPEVEGDPSLVDYQLFNHIPTDSSPESIWQVPIRVDAEGYGLVCDGKLPYPRWVLSDGLNAVRLQQSGPPIEMLTAFQRVAGMSQERIFDKGFLDLLVDGRRHEFDQIHLTPFGYENRSKADPQEASSLLLYRDRMWLTLSRPGKKVAWVLDDSTMVPRTNGVRTITRHGWDPSARCLVFQTVDDRPNQVSQRPAGYDGFDDQTVRDFVGADWWESIQGAAPKHTECWVAVGPADTHTDYAGSEPCKNGTVQEKVHAFAADGTGQLCIAIGSTRQGALVELEGTREGTEPARSRQIRRYHQVVQRRPALEIERQPLLTETAAMIPVFLESLKTGFTLMRSRPQDGAITGGWDQALITAPMMRAGDYEMPPRWLEHWLHQFQLDGQLFHVSDFDLSPAMLYRRWDTDDFVYLIAVAQWIAHTGDAAMLERLAPRCTHMLRVMLNDADPQVGLIPTRGVFPDWPSGEIGRKGITYPAMEMGLWYEVLRWWEGLAERLGEMPLATNLRSTAKKIRAHYAELYFDPEAGALGDAVYPGTLSRVRSFPTWALTPFHGAFGHELIGEEAPRLAERLLNQHIDLNYPGIRAASAGEFPTVFEHIHWPLFDHLVAKTMRRGNSRRGLEAMQEVIVRQYRWLHCACEALNMYGDITNEEMSRWTNWFGWSATGWYEALLSGVAGIWEEPGGLVYVPADMNQAVQLTNLPYRQGTWDISISGSGKWVRRFTVDGVEVAGICKVPESGLKPGHHTLSIERSDTPPTAPFVLDSVGLRLLATRWDQNGLHAEMAGPGRAFVRFYCDHPPFVQDAGHPLDVAWDQKTGMAQIEIQRSASEGELMIR